MSQQTPALAMSIQTQAVPAIKDLQADHIVPMVQEALSRAEQALNQALIHPSDYQHTLLPLEAVFADIDWIWGVVSHIENVNTNDVWHEAYQQGLALISAFFAKMGQNKALFDVASMLLAKDEALTGAQKRALEHQLLDFTLSGIDLPKDKQQAFLTHVESSSKAQSRFEHHVLKATDAWTVHITEEDKLAGLLPRHLAVAADAAQRTGLSGWLFDLKPDAYQSILCYAKDRSLRETMYKAYATRASHLGEHDSAWDNAPVLEEVLHHRLQKARLLGYDNPTQTILQTRMVKKADEVLAFLEDLLAKSHPQAMVEKATLAAFAKEKLDLDDLQPWDVAFASEALRQAKHGLDQEAIRAYFPKDTVLWGLLAWIEHLWGVRALVKQADTWHDSVEVLAFCDAKGEDLGYLYLDLCARKGKRGGAWVGSCRERMRLASGEVLLPVVFLTCNFAPAVGDKPSLLTHDDVVTLFHEMGHALHHLLTTVETPSVAGTSGVAWDAVELPSQWMEQWAWQPEVLKRISKHYQTGEVLPDGQMQALIDAKHFQTAMMVCRQIEFGLFDMHIHKEAQPLSAKKVHEILAQIRKKTSIFPPPDYHRFENSFGHIFAGGYASGYYSYLWAQVLSTDAFSLFQEQSSDQWPKLAQQFLATILSQGGAVDMQEAFVAFRGRAPDITALLNDLGLNT